MKWLELGLHVTAMILFWICAFAGFSYIYWFVAPIWTASTALVAYRILVMEPRNEKMP